MFGQVFLLLAHSQALGGSVLLPSLGLCGQPFIVLRAQKAAGLRSFIACLVTFILIAGRLTLLDVGLFWLLHLNGTNRRLKFTQPLDQLTLA